MSDNVWITNCTFFANKAGNGGPGGQKNYGNDGGGGAGGWGGGDFVNGCQNCDLVACTIVSNSPGLGGPVPQGSPPALECAAGGVYMQGDAQQGGFFNNLISLNTGQSRDVHGPFNSLGYNLVGITNGAAGFGARDDLLGSASAPLDPKVGPCADYGGPTPTVALLPGSPAIRCRSLLRSPAVRSTRHAQATGFPGGYRCLRVP